MGITANRSCLAIWPLALSAVASVPPAMATWSVVVVDTATGEIGVGAATCETGYDLSWLVPVIRIGHGGAVAQSGGDWDGHRRQIIWAGFESGASPNQILDALADKTPTHELHQYGIVDVAGRARCFTGVGVGYAAEVSGQLGSLVYAIQGNGIAGSAVIDAAEAALQDSDGDLPEKLMAAMEAAARLGGDGRCSCGPKSLQECASPVPHKFTKAAHIAFVFVARPGDGDVPCPPPIFCGNPNYYMMLNIADAEEDDPAPIPELRRRFDDFRARLTEVPDGIQTTATLDDAALVADGVSETSIRVAVRDWRGVPVGGSVRIRVRGEIDGRDAELEVVDVAPVGKGEFVLHVRAGTSPGDVALLVDVDAPRQRPTRIAPAPRITLKGRAASSADPTGESEREAIAPNGDTEIPVVESDSDQTASGIDGQSGATGGSTAFCPLAGALGFIVPLATIAKRRPRRR